MYFLSQSNLLHTFGVSETRFTSLVSDDVFRILNYLFREETQMQLDIQEWLYVFMTLSRS